MQKNSYSTPLDDLVPKHRQTARQVILRVSDPGETDKRIVIVVRVIYQRGGGKYYYVLSAIDDIQEFYPKEMGQGVVDAVIAAWAEYALTPPGQLSERAFTKSANFGIPPMKFAQIPGY
jgi:acyl-CoA synthetase (AMP-forming)/AMP-acid ligase II